MKKKIYLLWAGNFLAKPFSLLFNFYDLFIYFTKWIRSTSVLNRHIFIGVTEAIIICICWESCMSPHVTMHRDLALKLRSSKCCFWERDSSMLLLWWGGKEGIQCLAEMGLYSQVLQRAQVPFKYLSEWPAFLYNNHYKCFWVLR